MDAVVRPVFELAWNYVDLDDTLLSFERPPRGGSSLLGELELACTLKTP
jgi:hypothetical protein